MSVISNDDAQTVNSSIKSENFKEIWKIIDEHENNDPALKVTSLKPTQVKKELPKSPRKSVGSLISRLDNKLKPKVRNYNDKT